VRELGRIGPAAKAAVPDLIVLLKEDNLLLALFTAEALGQVGPEAKEAMPALRAMLKSQDPLRAEEAAKALGKIDPETARRDSIP
jgi:HEAT repeat protein